MGNTKTPSRYIEMPLYARKALRTEDLLISNMLEISVTEEESRSHALTSREKGPQLADDELNNFLFEVEISPSIWFL